MAIQIELRQDTAANFTSVNPILGVGEPAFEIDTLKFKIGNGTTVWNSLAYQGGSGTVSSVAMTVPSFLSVTGSPITESGTLAVTLSGTALPVGNGGTGVTTSTGTGSVVLSNSPTLAGTPLAPTATAGTNTTQIATTAFVATNFAALKGTASVYGGAKFSLSGTTLTITTT